LDRIFNRILSYVAPAGVSFSREQTHAVVASYLGWTLDAFDFFLLVFVMKDVANEFGTDIKTVAVAVTLTLAMRPIGAFIFGRAADRFGRRPTLIVDVLLFSVIEFATGFSPTLSVFLVLRALFGIAMGGEWGVGSSLAMETIPASARGFVSGLLQSGYPTGYLLASVVYGLLFTTIGWRGMFFVGVLPALLVLYIRRSVSESPHWQASSQGPRVSIFQVLRSNWQLAIYAIVLMTAFNFLSHGTQDLYPTFLQVQHGFDHKTVGAIAVIYNIGAILGGITCGVLSERYGRRRVMTVAALLVIPAIPLWAFGTGPVMLAIGAFIMQVMVQGAWGVIPAHLNELSPPAARGTFPGFVYQLGNLIASSNAVIQAMLAEQFGNNYGLALAIVVICAAAAIAALAPLGREARGLALGEPAR
jgi:SHS family lactate transporter-like MFS transporter